MKKFVFALALLACIASRAMFATADFLNGYKLPEAAPKPKHYTIELTLKADVDGVLENSFKGKVDIEFNDFNGTTFYLHRSKEMDIWQITYCGQTLNSTARISTIYTHETEILVIILVNCTNESMKNHLTIEYDGVLYQDMYGFYVSTLTTNDDAKTYKFATTQFQATFARRAFPCMDEPSFKATFDITIKHPNNYLAKSNQIEKPAGADNPCNSVADKECTSFEVTQVMPTYLVAFIVYPKDAMVCDRVQDITINNTDVSGINVLPMEVCSPKHLKNTSKYAIKKTRPIIHRLNEITKIPYQGVCDNPDKYLVCGYQNGMKQLNQFAIPDFAAGAMENWGLVTYRETALLYDDKESTWRDMQRISTVIAHEFAHMWFGNLVTLRWWSSTWLNEGFATYFEYHVINDIQKDWKMADQFVIEQMHSVLQKDVKEALALTSDVSTQNGIKAKFGSITYSKGACIIRMLERALDGEICTKEETECDYFFGSLNKYLNDHKFENTEPEQLFESFETSIINSDSVLKGKIAKFMESWTTQTGYPVVHVSISDKNTLTLKQSPFIYLKDDNSNNTWSIPITYYIEGEPESTKPKHLMEGAELKIGGLTEEQLKKFIIVNVGQTGYYRVHYEGELLDRLKSGLEKEDFSKISEINRAQIVDDTFNLARVGTVKYKDAFKIIDFLKNDDSYFSWYAAFNGFAYLRRRLPESGIKEDVTNLLKELMEKVYDKVNDFKDDEKGSISQIDMYKKIVVLQWACEIDLSTCRENALKMFNDNEAKTQNAEKINSTKTPANLRKIVYCEASRNTDNWDKVWNEYKTTTSAANKVTIITALGCVDDERMLKKYLGYSINPTSGIRKQDAYAVFDAVLSGSPKGVDVCLNFLIDEYDKIAEQYTSMNALSTVITSVAERLTTDAQIAKFNEFLDKENDHLDDAKAVIAVAKETIKSNQEWVKEHEPGLKETFNAASSIFSISFSALLLMVLSVNFLF